MNLIHKIREIPCLNVIDLDREHQEIANLIEKIALKTLNLEKGMLVSVYSLEDIEDVVKVFEGAWYDPSKPGIVGSICKNGSANLLTLDIPSSKLANANIAHTALVNIEKYKGENPKLTAFSAPKGA